VVVTEGQQRLVRATSCPTEDGTLILTGDCDVIDEDLPVNLFQPGILELWNPTGDLELVGSVPSGSNQTLTYFANMTLSKRWEQWSGTISYRRQQSDSSGLGSSTVADVVTGVLDWTPSPRWHSTLRVALTRQSQATQPVGTFVAVEGADLSTNLAPGVFFGGLGPAFTDVAESVALRAIEFSQDIDILTLWLNLNVRYRLTKRTSLFGNIIYWNQSSGGDSDFGREYDRYRVNIGVNYRFDPIRL
jgi:hypothetical protein